jgi:hypothetical protein
VEGDFDGFGGVTGGEEGADLFEDGLGELDVVGGAGLLVVKVGVGVEVGAVAGGAALEVDLADEVALHKGFEAVVHGGEGDGGHLGADTGVNFVGGGVIAFFEQGSVDYLALGSVAQAAVGEAFGEGSGWFEGRGAHTRKGMGVGRDDRKEGRSCGRELESFQGASGNWNNSKEGCGRGIEMEKLAKDFGVFVGVCGAGGGMR